MNETWEQTKERLRKTGIVVPVPATKPIPIKRDEVTQFEDVDLYDVKKVTLPVDPAAPQGTVVLYNVTREEADWWIAEKLKAKSYEDDTTGMKTLVFYEKFLVGGKPKERSIYSNPARFSTEQPLDYKGPKRVK